MDTTSARRLLDAERTRLQELKGAAARLTESALEAASNELSHVPQHPGDLGSDVEEREKDLALQERISDEYAEVEAALERLEQGAYGTCATCGKPIPDERLEAVPTARYCLEDQSRAERGVAG